MQPACAAALHRGRPGRPGRTGGVTSGTRQKYLVIVGGCDDCHSPKIFKEQGPEPDMSRRLSGHPAADKLPVVPAGVLGPDKFGAVGANDFTACRPVGHQLHGEPDA